MAEAFAMSVASNLVSKLGQYLFAPIGRQFGYILCYKSYVEDLKNGVRKLETARERVQHSVEKAENNGKLIESDIKIWLESVENKAMEARNLLEHGESAKNACFHGWLPNAMVCHPISRKVKKMTRVIQGLHDESANINFQNVYHESPPIGVVPATSSAARAVEGKEDVLESRAEIIEDVMKALSDKKVSVIGVYGPGGIGKSKLLEDVKIRVFEENLFNVVVIANVSCNPNIKTIQGEIAYALGLNLIDEETVSGRADRLNKRLERDSKKKILIILDDLWKKLELKEVGIPCTYDNKIRGCKLLLSSRNGQVLHTDMGSDREFRLKELDDGEARRLFERTLGDGVHYPEFKPLVDGVVKNCGGLPLCIISLAKRLRRGKSAAWRNALNIEGSDLKSLVEQNYKDLKDERIRSLFLICALASSRILTPDALVYCLGLGLYNNFSKTIEDARDRLIMDLDHMQDFSLLLDGDNKVRPVMHDMIRDVAISSASKEWNALVGRKDCGFKEWSKDELRECTVMAFHNVEIGELPEKLDCPNLRMLMLIEDNPSLKIPESFFESMENLQVLDLTDLSFTSLPSSIEFLKNLNSLCLCYCHMKDVTILGKLKGLQFLCIANCTITHLPKEIGKLIGLRSLELTGCTSLKVIEPGVLGNLVNLEELYMDHFDQWEAEDEAPRSNASLIELKNMDKLSTLHIVIPHSAVLPSDLPFEKLNKHVIQIGKVWDCSGAYKESRTLKFNLDSGNLLIEKWMQRCLQRTQHLQLDGLQDDNDSINNLCIEGFQKLKHLHIQNSPSVQYVVHSTENVQCTAFTILESLFVENLNNLEKICCGCLALESFNELKIVKVDNCGKMKDLFPSSMTRILSQLEEIEISRCHLMQQIIADPEVEDRDEIADPNVKPCNLRRLTLRNLPKMTSFYKTADHSVDFFDGQQLIKLQSLEAITIERCHLIREVFDLEGLAASGEVKILSRLRELTLSDLPCLGRIWNKNSQRTLCFSNLRALKVQKCENLRFLFSSSIAKALEQIKEIEIASCKLMEEIIDVQEEELEEATTTNTLVFPLLTSLSLEKLPNLKTFSCGKYCIHCPFLTRLTISECPKMTTFSSFDGRQQSMIAGTGSKQAFGHILSLPSFFNEKVLFPSLEELKLSSMGQLKRIWHNQLCEQSFYKLASLTIEICENLSHVFPSNLMDRLQSLNEIEVVRCPSLEALFEPVNLSSEKRQKPLVISALKKMKLSNLPSLRAILKSDCKITLAFPSLMKVKVRHCHSLPYLFSSATAQTLDKLAVLDVSCCNNLRGIIAMEEGKGKPVKKFKFRSLSTLKLGDLENLICFSSENCDGDELHPLFDKKLAFPKLEGLHRIVLVVEEHQLKHPRIGVWFRMCSEENNLHLIGFPAIESMEISQIPNIEKIWVDELASDAFSKLERLMVDRCGKLASIFSSDTIITRSRNLKELIVIDCGSVEVVFQVGEINMSRAHTTSSFRLRKLNLERLPKLKHVWSGHPGGTLKFECLRCFKATDCESLQNLFPSSVAKSMTQLEQLSVSSCGVEDIIAEEDGGAGTSEGGGLFFPRLNMLTLVKMPELRHFYKNSHTSTWPLLSALFSVEKIIKLQNLEAITVERCQLIREVFDLEELTTSGDVEILWQLTKLTLSDLTCLERIWNQNPKRALCFQNLKALKVQNCEILRFLFSSSMAKALVQIKEIEIASCVLMEEIMYVQKEELEEATPTDTFEFPLLTSLSLEELPNLKTFSYGKYCIHCPSLTRLTIIGCPKMMTFTSFEFEGRQHSMTVDTGLQQAFGCINSDLSLPGFFNEKVLFPSLEELKLSSMCQLKRIWHNQLHEPSFCKLSSLTVELCENLSHVFSSSSMDMLRSLNKIKAIGCPSLEALFEPISPNAEKRQKPFPSLMEVNVSGCHSLPYLFSSATAKTLHELVVLDVSCCNNLQSIIAMEEGKGKTVETFKFPHLTKLKLDDLKSLMCFSSESCAGDGLHPLFDEKVEFPTMESMKILHMDNMEKIWFDDLDSNAFGKLKTLVVEHCEKLLSIFSSYNMLTRFQNLEKITVTDCGSLEVAFQVQEFEFSEACSTNSFQLGEIVLTQLPKMKLVWNGLPQGGLTFGCLQRMEVVKCESLKSLFPSSVAKNMTQFKELLVRDCGVEEIIMEKDGVGMSASDLFFPQLTDLRLLELPKLGSFYRNSHTSAWPLLKKLRVRHCGKMRSFLFACEFQGCQGTTTSENQFALFSFEEVISHLEELTLTREDVMMMMPQHYVFHNLKEVSLACYHDENVAFSSNLLLHRFPNLETLNVICSSFEEIFPENSSGHGGATPCGELTDMEKPLQALRNLKQLILYKLCNLKRVWKDGSLIAEILTKIEVLQVLECPSLSIVLPSPTSFQRLTGLLVEDCDGLVHMGTCVAVTSLVHLTWLILRNCGAMEEVVTDDGNGVEEISFPKLKWLTLDDLPSLESFSPTSCTFRFPSLVRIVIMKCPKMNIFCKGGSKTPNLDKVLLFEEDDEGRWEGDLNTTIRTLSA